jgi:thiamine biosynthesis lipoprotein
MATRFEIVLQGASEISLRAAGEEALDEIERLDAQLSLYRSSSEIAHLNARAAFEPVRVSPNLFALLEQARKLSCETAGAFDVTVAPLVRCWGFMRGDGRLPEAQEIAEACAKTGMHRVILDPNSFSVRFDQSGVMLDLGAIGKGYAIERAAELLREAGVTSALLHGGTSTICAIGKPLDPPAEGWKVALETPPDSAPTPGLLTTILLSDQALSVSAVWGKSFRAGDKILGHVIDPRTGQPASESLMAAVVLPSATETDALSTALLIGGKNEFAALNRLRKEMRTLLVTRGEAAGGFEIEVSGIPVSHARR